jgi:hypothetical protein
MFVVVRGGWLAVVGLAAWVGCPAATVTTEPGVDAGVTTPGAGDAAVLDAGGDVMDAGRVDAAGVLAPDGGAGDAAVAPDGGTRDAGGRDANYTYTCTPVGSAYSDGFFTLETFGDKLYAGLFGYQHESQSMLYRFPAWELTSPGLTGVSESVCALAVHDGFLWANTESSGDIFRSADGSHWERVHDGDADSIGCGLAVLDGKLYAINYRNAAEDHGRVLRWDGASWTVVYDSGSAPLYVREIVTYNNTLYVFAVMNNQGQVLSSANGTSWTLRPVENRYFRGHVAHGYLWLGSTDRSAAGEVGVWRFDGTTYQRMHRVTDQRYVTDIKDVDGDMFAATSNGWKEDVGPSGLLLSRDQGVTWLQVCRFPETAAWNMAVFRGEVYVGTWTYGGTGHVYRVTKTDVGPTPPVDCGLISAANGAWEVCESSAEHCAGVFTDGAGCAAFCAAAGLQCTARYGGEPGCRREPNNVLACGDSNGHASDWCVCGRPPNPDPPGDCAARSGSLALGATHTVHVDAHTGDEDTTQPRTDANDGQAGDNPRFRRHNVARAHNDYWYTSTYQSPGEPDPRGEQWVDYTPDFPALGVGCYRVVARYRGTDSRATYAAQYRVLSTRDGDVLVERVQQRAGGAYLDEDLGNHVMCPGSKVRIQDPGAGSITFNEMRFTYLGSVCPP